MPPHFLGSNATGRLGWMQLFPKMNFHTMLWSCFIWEGLGAITVATYQMRLSIRVLHTKTRPAYVRDFLDPISARIWFRPLIFLSQVMLLLSTLREQGLFGTYSLNVRETLSYSG